MEIYTLCTPMHLIRLGGITFLIDMHLFKKKKKKSKKNAFKTTIN